jgi:hypothetical protein
VSGQSTDPNTQLGTIYESGWFHNDSAGANTPGVAPFGALGRGVFHLPCQLVSAASGAVELLGYIDGLHAVHGRGLTEEDRIELLDGRRFIAYPDIGGAPISKWLLLEEQ